MHSQPIIPKRMNHYIAIHSMVLAAFLATLPAMAQSPAAGPATGPATPADPAPSLNLDPSLQLDPPPAPSRNRLGLSFRVLFNAPVSFKNLDPIPAGTAARLTPDGDVYNYDNGYVLVDSSGNAMGYTRYWGYDTASQSAVNGVVSMQRTKSVSSSYTSDPSDDFMPGVELTYDRELIHKKSWRGGLEGAFGYTYMSVSDSQAESATVTSVIDTFAFPGESVPPAGYTGYRSGYGDSPSGPVLAAVPTTSIVKQEAGAVVSGHRDFSADLLGLRIGPYVEVPLSKSISLGLSGGLALVYVSSDFNFHETIILPGGTSTSNAGSGSHNDWLAGGYVAGTLSFALSEKWAVVAGAQFQDVGRYTQHLKDKEATLDLRNMIFATLGISYSF